VDTTPSAQQVARLEVRAASDRHPVSERVSLSDQSAVADLYVSPKSGTDIEHGVCADDSSWPEDEGC
jgi:hypothetical protein